MNKVRLCVVLFFLVFFSGFIFFSTDGSSKEIKTSDLVGWWRFEGEGLQAEDASGNSNHGELIGAPKRGRTLAGEIGQNSDIYFKGPFLEIDGKNDYVKINHSEELSLTGMLTIECWIRPSDWSNGSHQTFMEKGTHVDRSVNYIFGKTSNEYDPQYRNALKFTYNNGTWEDWIDASGFRPIDGKWYHLAVTVNEKMNQAIFYVNGKRIHTAVEACTNGVWDKDNFAEKPIIKNKGPLYIGANAIGAELYKGAIAEVKIYNKVLTADEIKDSFLKDVTRSAGK